MNSVKKTLSGKLMENRVKKRLRIWIKSCCRSWLGCGNWFECIKYNSYQSKTKVCCLGKCCCMGSARSSTWGWKSKTTSLLWLVTAVFSLNNFYDMFWFSRFACYCGGVDVCALTLSLSRTSSSAFGTLVAKFENAW